MDTTVMEYTAEDLIAHKLQRCGILVAKPKFDRDGADLLGLLNVDDGARFCRIQCKGRSIAKSRTTSVEVFEDYVTKAFVLFLFAETGDAEVTHLFAFFGDEIREKWALDTETSRSVYRLGISAKRLGELQAYVVTDARLATIRQLIQHANVTGEFALVFSGRAELTVGGIMCSAKASFTPPEGNVGED